MSDYSKMVAQAKVSALKIDARASLARRAMDRTVTVDQHRQMLSHFNPGLNEVFSRFEMAFIQGAESEVREFGSPLDMS